LSGTKKSKTDSNATEHVNPFVKKNDPQNKQCFPNPANEKMEAAINCLSFYSSSNDPSIRLDLRSLEWLRPELLTNPSALYFPSSLIRMGGSFEIKVRSEPDSCPVSSYFCLLYPFCSVFFPSTNPLIFGKSNHISFLFSIVCLMAILINRVSNSSFI